MTPNIPCGVGAHLLEQIHAVEAPRAGLAHDVEGDGLLAVVAAAAAGRITSRAKRVAVALELKLLVGQAKFHVFLDLMTSRPRPPRHPARLIDWPVNRDEV